MPWNPSFFRASPLYWPIAPAAALLERCAEWPTAEELTQALAADAGVRFELARPRPRRARSSAIDRYDARIAIDGIVPTRAGSWHDVLNALVWASFPRTKRVLHARQHRIISARLGTDLRLPPTRTREQDAVAMLDEGGVVLLAPPGREADAVPVIFGHAIYEELACGRPLRVRAAAYRVDTDATGRDARDQVRMADAALASLLARDAEISRDDFGSYVVAAG